MIGNRTMTRGMWAGVGLALTGALVVIAVLASQAGTLHAIGAYAGPILIGMGLAGAGFEHEKETGRASSSDFGASACVLGVAAGLAYGGLTDGTGGVLLVFLLIAIVALAAVGCVGLGIGISRWARERRHG